MIRIVLIFLLLCSPALAHDASHPELNEWFNRLASGRGLCCFTEPNRVGRTMVWPLRFDGQILIRCFMPGSMG